jgi:hypothetical protein
MLGATRQTIEDNRPADWPSNPSETSVGNSMITPQQSDRGKEDVPIPRDALNALIGRHVIHSLGSPDNILKVKVHPLGNDHYRVNVLVGKDIASARIGNSFFLTADGDGNIVTSSPKIARLY